MAARPLTQRRSGMTWPLALIGVLACQSPTDTSIPRVFVSVSGQLARLDGALGCVGQWTAVVAAPHSVFYSVAAKTQDGRTWTTYTGFVRDRVTVTAAFAPAVTGEPNAARFNYYLAGGLNVPLRDLTATCGTVERVTHQ
jgi:hypothetical protein